MSDEFDLTCRCHDTDGELTCGADCACCCHDEPADDIVKRSEA